MRHPIYLGLAVLAVGEALAFGRWPALFIALSGIVPTLAWRARAEEKLLSRTFGELQGLSTANQDDRPVPSLDPAHDGLTEHYAMHQRYSRTSAATFCVNRPLYIVAHSNQEMVDMLLDRLP